MKLDDFREQFRTEAAEPSPEIRPTPDPKPSALARGIPPTPRTFSYEADPDAEWNDMSLSILQEAQTVGGWTRVKVWKVPNSETLNASDKVFISDQLFDLDPDVIQTQIGFGVSAQKAVFLIPYYDSLKAFVPDEPDDED